MLQDLIIACDDDALPLPLTADALLRTAQAAAVALECRAQSPAPTLRRSASRFTSPA